MEENVSITKIINENNDKLEIGTPAKGGAVRVSGDFNKPDEFKKKVDKDYPLSDDSGLGNTQYHKDRTINLVAEESSNVSQKEMVLV